jgi:hypothetical protein
MKLKKDRPVGFLFLLFDNQEQMLFYLSLDVEGQFKFLLIDRVNKGLTRYSKQRYSSVYRKHGKATCCSVRYFVSRKFKLCNGMRFLYSEPGY